MLCQTQLSHFSYIMPEEKTIQMYSAYRIYVDTLSLENNEVRISGILYIYLISITGSDCSAESYIDPVYISSNMAFHFNGEKYKCCPEFLKYNVEFDYDEDKTRTLIPYNIWKYQHMFHKVLVSYPFIKSKYTFPFNMYDIELSIHIHPFPTSLLGIHIVIDPLISTLPLEYTIHISSTNLVKIWNRGSKYIIRVANNPFPHIYKRILPLLSIQWSIAFFHKFKYSNIMLLSLASMYYISTNINKIYVPRNYQNYIHLQSYNFMLQSYFILSQPFYNYNYSRMNMIFPVLPTITLLMECIRYTSIPISKKYINKCDFLYRSFGLIDWRLKNKHVLRFALLDQK
jgi:hypothetical protein